MIEVLERGEQNTPVRVRYAAADYTIQRNGALKIFDAAGNVLAKYRRGMWWTVGPR